MPYKICPHCQGKSYSASTAGRWICPYCRRDISNSRVFYHKWKVVRGNIYLMPWVQEIEVEKKKLLS